MEILIGLGLGFVGGVIGTLLLAKWQPTWFLTAVNTVASVTKVTGSANTTLTTASK